MIGFTNPVGVVMTYRASVDIPPNRRVKITDAFTSPPTIGLAGSGEQDVGINFRGALSGTIVAVRPRDDLGIMVAEPAVAIEEILGPTVIGAENTGDGVAVATRGVDVKVGTYVATCVNTDTTESELWSLVSPTGATLTTTLTTQVPYSDAEINVTIGFSWREN